MINRPRISLDNHDVDPAHTDALCAGSDPATSDGQRRPLTATQRAYLRGREPGQPLGGVDCMALFEFHRDVGGGDHLDIERLRAAVATLRRHPVMRSAILDGEHREITPAEGGGADLPLTISVDDARHDRTAGSGDAEDTEGAGYIEEICAGRRAEILARHAHYGAGELGWIDILRGETTEIVHVAVSLVAADLAGVGVVLNDLAAAYVGGAEAGDEQRPGVRTFADIARDERAGRRRAPAAGPKPDRAAEYDHLPPPPTFGGLLRRAETIGHGVIRRETTFSADRWEALGRAAEVCGSTRPGLVLAVYRHAVGLWSGRDALSIVVPGLDHRATPRDVLDRTQTWVVRPDAAAGRTLGEAAREATAELRRRIGIGRDSIDELGEALRRGEGHPGVLPVVLTCGGEAVLCDPRVEEVFGSLTATGSVTPQVLCDLQVLRIVEDEVHVALDVRSGAYPRQVGEELFDAVVEGLAAIADAAEQNPDDGEAVAGLMIDDVVRLPSRVRDRRAALRRDASAPAGLLHEPFLRRVELDPEAVAVIDPAEGGALTYAELHRAAMTLARSLADAVAPGDVVGIRLPKGRDQVTAVMAAMYLGATYLPVSVDAPQERLSTILSVALPAAVIERVDPSVYEESSPRPDAEAAPEVLPRALAPEDPAYVIFTSGSTGTPKGVVVSHAAASTTIDAVVERHAIGPADRVLTVSSLDFDLSVFDIFGLLGAGGALVCIGEGDRRDAFAWAELIRRHGVTVWNSAPALADMLAVAAGAEHLPLRLALVSGDWVPLDLPGRLWAIAEGIRVVAMGGATEAGIWSNEYILDGPADLPEGWPSVPYGRPLPGQEYRVVDEDGRDCPTGVTGELWIGGRSLAEGYIGRDDLTEERFVWQRQGNAPAQRWYRTGDLGYWAAEETAGEGNDLLFFVGRRDDQVKIRGHRVELGDVEHHLCQVDGVDKAIALPEPGHRALAAVVIPAAGARVTPEEVRGHLERSLPEFMVPREIAVVESVGLTANGKLDRAWAARHVASIAGIGDEDPGLAPRPDRAATLTLICEAWARALGNDAPGEMSGEMSPEANFFALGGDSLAATEACAELRARGVGVTAAELFAHPRLEDFAAVCAAAQPPAPDPRAGRASAPAGAVDPADEGEAFPLCPLQRSYALGADGIRGTVRSLTVYAAILRRRGEGPGAAPAEGFTRAEVTAVARDLASRCPSLRVVRAGDDAQRAIPSDEAVTVTVMGEHGGVLREALEDWEPRTPLELIIPREDSPELGVAIDYFALDGRSLAEIVGALSDALAGSHRELSGSIAEFAAFCRAAAPPSGVLLDSAPRPPRLPVIRIPERAVGFHSLRATVPASDLARRARRLGVTPSAYLLAEYGAVLAGESGLEDVGVVVPLIHRPAEAGAGRPPLLGCFSQLAVCRCRRSPDHRGVQDQLVEGMAGLTPAPVSEGRRGAYPAVFTSVLGYDSAALSGAGGGSGAVVEPVWSLTRTPGVLIDCQVCALGADRGLVELRWDIPRGVLDEPRLSSMFERFAQAVGATVAEASPPRGAAPGIGMASGLLEAVTRELDARGADVVPWARPIVAAWRRFVSEGPEGTGLRDAPVPWSARDARYLADVVCGKARRYSLLEHPVLSPRGLASVEPAVMRAMDVVRQRIALSPGASVVEIGFGVDPSLSPGRGSWTVVEPDDRIADLATVEGRTCVGGVEELAGPADLVLACGTLHRDPRLPAALASVPLGVEAEVHLVEAQRMTAASLLSAAVLNPAILQGDLAVSDAEQLLRLLSDRGLALRYLEAEDGHTLVLRAAPGEGTTVPAVAAPVPDRAGEGDAPRSLAASLEEIWRRHLPDLDAVPSPLPGDTNFFHRGGDSLIATRVVADLHAVGHEEARAVDLFNEPTFGGFLERWFRTGRARRTLEPAVEPSREAPRVPFDRWPLTRVQRAYLAGEDPDQLLGGVPARCWFLFDSPRLDVDRLRAAAKAVVERHPALRALLDRSGETFVVQPSRDAPPILSEVPDAELAVRGYAPDHRETGPLALFADGRRLGISMSNLLLDGASMMLVMEDLSRAYEDPGAMRKMGEGAAVLAEYLARRPWLVEESVPVPTAAGPLAPEDLANRVDRVLAAAPPAPLVPPAVDVLSLNNPRMERVSADLPADRWKAACARWAELRVTPAAGVLAAFARALADETHSDSLTINVTRFDRDLTAPGIAEVAGDFTALSLVSLRGLRSRALAGTAAEAQAELFRAGEPERDTLRVAARAVRATGDPAAGLFPVVFTCGLGLSGGPNRNRAFAEQSFGTRVAAGSTTPQVVLDLQVVDDRDGLHLTADYLTQILPEARVQRIVDRTVEALIGGTESPGGPSETPDPIAEAWASALSIPASSLTEETNFFREGGDSLRATEVVRRLRDRGMRVSLRSLLARPTLGDFRSELTRSELTPEGPGHKDDGDEWFDLTDVQASYLLGRTSAYRDGGIACQGYAEFAVDASLLASARGKDPERYPARELVAAVTEAWDRVVALHPMLCAVIDREGRQRIDRRAEVPLRVVEVPGEAGAAEAVRADVRRELCEKNYPIGQAPMLDAVLTLGHGDPVFHFSVDLIITDYVGIRTVVADLDRCLAEPGSPPSAPEASFRDWIEERARRRRTPEGRAAIERDRAWWKDRLGDLPPALVFSPDDAGAESTGDAGTTRRSLALDEAEWNRFCEVATDAGVTPSALVLGLFMAVARRYADLDLAEQDRALVTVTTVDRAEGSRDLSRVVGDFTSTVLVDAPLGADPRKNALGVQGSLMDALEHSEYPGVRVLRDLRTAGGERRRSVPVVFTSTVGVRAEEEPRVLRLVPGSAISKTPQVLLDVQLSPVGEGVTVDWDSRDGGFHPGVLDQAFEDFRIAVEETAAVGEMAALPPRTPVPTGRVLTLAEVSGDPADAFLHGPFLRRVLEDPDAPAVLHKGRSVSRGELYAEAVRIARTLPEGEGPVVVAEDLGVAQIASQLAALLTGRPFVPIDPHWPEARRRGVVDVLRCAAGESSGASAHVRGEPVELPTADAAPEQAPAWEEARGALREALAGGLARPVVGARSGTKAVVPGDLAYVIFTSGSTGTPKGVAVTHSQVRATLDDMHGRLDLGPRDRVLAVSRPSFDLAIFNVFGLLGAGGAVVIPACGTTPDPETWERDIREHDVTVWNSVPAQLTILLDRCAAPAPTARPLPLQRVLVSGDRVPDDQPARLWETAPGAEFLALGGATEGSIWSIAHRCDPTEAGGPIPYGRALSGQAVWVLNRDGEAAAPGQRGEIAIAGAGVAAGYLGSDEAGRRAFGMEEATGERRYLTGDAGVCRRDGVILFGGRLGDGQVKIRGHRIEIGDVENAVRSVEGIADALVAAGPPSNAGAQELVAVVVPERRPVGEVDPLAERLRLLHERIRVDGADAEAFRRIRDLAVDAARDAMAAQVARARDAVVSQRHPRDDRGVTVEELAVALGAGGRTGLIARWLGELRSAGRITVVDGAVTSVVALDSPAAREDRWAEISRLDCEIGYGGAQLEYLRRCLDSLPGLLDGSVDPLSLLFPEGDTAVARAAYGGNMLSSYLNAVCAEVVAHRVGVAADERPCRIVEIGGGVGGTTADILAALDGVPSSRWDYLFTDVSRYFTDLAAREWPALRTGLLDINRPAAGQGVPDGSADVVVCANVLHNAKDIRAAVEAVFRMLAPGGVATIIDSTAPNAPLMASMEFKEGLTGATDARARTGSPFFALAEWREALDASLLETVAVMPPAGDVLERGAQHVFVLRRPDGGEASPQTAAVPTPEAVREAVARLVPEYMVPRRVAVVDSLPMTPNGKRDRSAVVGLVGDREATPGVLAAPTPQRGGRDAVERAWREVLDLPTTEALPGDADFHELGGDSLLLARCIGQMRRDLGGDLPSWDETLRAIVADPTPDGCRRALGVATRGDAPAPPRRASAATSDPAPPRITSLVAGSGPVTVLIHDGSGTLGPYGHLVEELRGRGAGAVLGIERSPGDAYLETDAGILFHELTERYSDALLDALESTEEPVSVVGYCMGGLLAVGIADRMAACGFEAAATVVSSYRMPFTVTDPRLLDFSFARLLRARPQDMGLDVDEELLGSAICSAREAGVADITAGALDRHADPRLRAQLREAPSGSADRLAAFLAAHPEWDQESLASLREVYVHSLAAVVEYSEPPVAVPVRFLRQRGALSFLPGLREDMTSFWREHCLGELEVVDVDGDHFSCLDPRHVAGIADLMYRSKEIS